MKSKTVSTIIKNELKIWKTTYPNNAKVLDKFAHKLIHELQYRVKDLFMAGSTQKTRKPEKVKK